jgi:hypothetical protein
MKRYRKLAPAADGSTGTKPVVRRPCVFLISERHFFPVSILRRSTTAFRRMSSDQRDAMKLA